MGLGDVENAVNMNVALYQQWLLSVTHPHYGRMEAGRSLSVSAQAAMASFSPFHRLRGGYEDAVIAIVAWGEDQQSQQMYTPLVSYFGVTTGLLDAPRVSYTTPSVQGLRFGGEIVPSGYRTDIGGAKKNAYALTADYTYAEGNLRYDARISYAHNTLNSYLPRDLSMPSFDGLLFGNQVNASMALS